MFESFVRNNVLVLTAFDSDYEKVVIENKRLISLLYYHHVPEHFYIIINLVTDIDSTIIGYFKEYRLDDALNPKYLFDLIIQDIKSEYSKDPCFTSNVTEENIGELRNVLETLKDTLDKDSADTEQLHEGYHQLQTAVEKDSMYFKDTHNFYKFYEEHFFSNGNRLITANEMQTLINKIDGNYDNLYLDTVSKPYRFCIHGKQMFYGILNRLTKDLLIYEEDVYDFRYTVKENKIIVDIQVMCAYVKQSTWYHRVADFLDLFNKHGIVKIDVIPQSNTFNSLNAFNKFDKE